jgi:hypothetical protein
MSVIELPRIEGDIAERPPDTAVEFLAAAARRPSELDDADFAHLFKQGALFGTPTLYILLAGVCWLAAPGQPVLLLAALWPALVAGWYFGGIVALTLFELREQRRWKREVRIPLAPEPPVRLRPAALVG